MDVPDGWQSTVLSAVADVRLGRQRSPSRAEGPNMRPYLRAANIGWGHLKLDDVKEMDFTPAEYETYALRPGDILLNEASGSPAEVGKPAIYGGEIDGVCFQNTLLRVRATADAHIEFLFHFLMRAAQYGELGDSSTGTNIQHIGRARLAGWPLALPPLAEQKKIAEILGSVDEAIRVARAVIDQTRKVKQALLQELLTRGIGHTRFKQTEIGEIPESWEVAPLDEVATIQSGKAKNKNSKGSLSLPYLRVANVQDGYLDMSEIKYIDATPEDLDRYGLCDGDVLLTEGGDADKLGRGTVWAGQLSPCLHQNHIFAVRCSDVLRSHFLAYWAGSQRGKAYFLSAAKQTTNLASINKHQLSKLPVPLTSLDEQDEILCYLQTIEDAARESVGALARLQRLKTGLMSDLLSGRVRVKV